MGSNAFLGSKTKFYISDFEHGPYTLLAEVLGVEGLSLIRDVSEVTHLNVTNKYRSHIGGFRDPGSVNLNLNFTHDTYVIVMDHFEDDDFKWYRIELPNFERTIFQFKGLMINCPVVIRTTESVTCNSSIKLSGAIQFGRDYDVTSSELRLATNDGGAMFFHDSLDFSPYAGALGDTTYMAQFVDSAGKKATGYVIEAGEGVVGDPSLPELGSELLVNGDFSSGDSTGWNTNGSPHGNYTLDCSDNTAHLTITAAGSRVLRQEIAFDSGGIYKVSGELIEASYTVHAFLRLNTGGGSGVPTLIVAGAQSNPGVYSGLATVTTQDRLWSGFTSSRPIGDYFITDNYSVKKVIDTPNTGLRLVSTLDGSTRNMASVESGFNPKAVVTVRIYKVK